MTQVKQSYINNLVSPMNPTKVALTPTNHSKIFKEEEYLLPKKSPEFKGKKTLVLDLDETLVHSSFVPFPKSDVVLDVNLEGVVYNIYVLVRPEAQEFIAEMAKYFELVVFTASISKYASPLLDILDEGNCIKYRLYRDHCTFLNGIFVKDLKKLNRNIKDVIIVDNSPLAYAFDSDNGLPIKTWFDDPEDNELNKLKPILKYMSELKDVRHFIEKIVKNNEINFKEAMRLIHEKTCPKKSKIETNFYFNFNYNFNALAKGLNSAKNSGSNPILSNINDNKKEYKKSATNLINNILTNNVNNASDESNINKLSKFLLINQKSSTSVQDDKENNTNNKNNITAQNKASSKPSTKSSNNKRTTNKSYENGTANTYHNIYSELTDNNRNSNIQEIKNKLSHNYDSHNVNNSKATKKKNSFRSNYNQATNTNPPQLNMLSNQSKKNMGSTFSSFANSLLPLNLQLPNTTKNNNKLINNNGSRRNIGLNNNQFFSANMGNLKAVREKEQNYNLNQLQIKYRTKEKLIGLTNLRPVSIKEMMSQKSTSKKFKYTNLLERFENKAKNLRTYNSMKNIGMNKNNNKMSGKSEYGVNSTNFPSRSKLNNNRLRISSSMIKENGHKLVSDISKKNLSSYNDARSRSTGNFFGLKEKNIHPRTPKMQIIGKKNDGIFFKLN